MPYYNYVGRLTGDSPARQPPLREDEAITAYKRLILELPRANQYLLLYVLDLLSVFARKAETNLMTATST
jgi:GTPase-activating protein SAC7